MSLAQGTHRNREETLLPMREKGATDWSLTTFTTILEGKRSLLDNIAHTKPLTTNLCGRTGKKGG